MLQNDNTVYESLIFVLQDKPKEAYQKCLKELATLGLGLEPCKELLAFADSIEKDNKIEPTSEENLDGKEPIKTLAKYLDAVASTGFGQPIYRGHNYRHYTLLPSLYRREHDEKDLREQFQQEAAAYRDTNGFLPLDHLALMQHHGAPTRLLDWSESPLVALYFALEGVRAVAAPCVWVLDVKSQYLGGLQTQEKARKWLENEYKDKAEEQRHICFSPSYKNLRIVQQKGVFLAVPSAKKDTCLSEILDRGTGLLRLDIDVRYIAKLREELLQKLDFKATDIYPDLYGLAKKLQAGNTRAYDHSVLREYMGKPKQDLPSYIT